MKFFLYYKNKIFIRIISFFFSFFFNKIFLFILSEKVLNKFYYSGIFNIN